MIRNLILKWKQEWWLKNASILAKEYQSKQVDLEKKLSEEVSLKIQKLELERDILYAQVRSEIERGKLLQEEVTYRTKTLEDRKMELIREDNELREQIKVLQAKAAPDQVWTHAFTAGVSKTIDMLIPTITEGFDKFKVQVREEAMKEAIARLRAPNKK